MPRNYGLILAVLFSVGVAEAQVPPVESGESEGASPAQGTSEAAATTPSPAEESASEANQPAAEEPGTPTPESVQPVETGLPSSPDAGDPPEATESPSDAGEPSPPEAPAPNAEGAAPMPVTPSPVVVPSARNPHGTGGHPPGMGRMPPSARRFVPWTRLVEVTPDGVLRPLADADAVLLAFTTRPSPHGPQRVALGTWPGRSTSDGILRFNGLEPRAEAQYEMQVVFQGLSYRSVPFGTAGPFPPEMRVYHARLGPGPVRFRAHWEIAVGESYLRVTQVVRMVNDTSRTIDYTHSKHGLRLPTLSAPVGGRVLLWGMFPNGKVHGNPQPSLGQGRVVGEAGAIVYRGPVPPGEQLFVRFAYSMPYETSLLHLAAVSEVDIEEAAVALRWTDRVSPRGILGNPHRAVHGTQDEFRQSVFLLTEPVPAGEPILLTLANLPIQSKMPVWLTTAGGAGMIVFFLLAVIGVALRRRAQHAAS